MQAPLPRRASAQRRECHSSQPVTPASLQRKQATPHANTSFEKLNQMGHSNPRTSFPILCIAQGTNRHRNGLHKSLSTEDRVYVKEPPAVSHHNSSLRHKEKTFAVKTKP